jgi:hypothetical protein
MGNHKPRSLSEGFSTAGHQQNSPLTYLKNFFLDAANERPICTEFFPHACVMDSPINNPLTLKCGLKLKNRLVKAAMAECIADSNGLPTNVHNNIYKQWGAGGWGMVFTGVYIYIYIPVVLASSQGCNPFTDGCYRQCPGGQNVSRGCSRYRV